MKPGPKKGEDQSTISVRVMAAEKEDLKEKLKIMGDGSIITGFRRVVLFAWDNRPRLLGWCMDREKE